VCVCVCVCACVRAWCDRHQRRRQLSRVVAVEQTRVAMIWLSSLCNWPLRTTVAIVPSCYWVAAPTPTVATSLDDQSTWCHCSTSTVSNCCWLMEPIQTRSAEEASPHLCLRQNNRMYADCYCQRPMIIVSAILVSNIATFVANLFIYASIRCACDQKVEFLESI